MRRYFECVLSKQKEFTQPVLSIESRLNQIRQRQAIQRSAKETWPVGCEIGRGCELVQSVFLGGKNSADVPVQKAAATGNDMPPSHPCQIIQTLPAPNTVLKLSLDKISAGKSSSVGGQKQWNIGVRPCQVDIVENAPESELVYDASAQ